MKTNIGKYFFRLLNKHFPPGHSFWKTFYGNTLRLSYSYMPNLKARIDELNKKTLEKTLLPKTNSCNCLKKENYPMSVACLSKIGLYYAKRSCDNKKYKPKLYIVNLQNYL